MVDIVRSQLNRIKKRLDAVQSEKTVPRPGDCFESTMRPFYGSAHERVDALLSEKEAVFSDLKALGIWLNEPKDANFKYLKTLNEFGLNFERSIKAVEARKARMAEIEKRRKWAAAKRRKKEENAAAKLKRGGVVAAKKRKRTERECKEEEDGETVDGGNGQSGHTLRGAVPPKQASFVERGHDLEMRKMPKFFSFLAQFKSCHFVVV